MSSVVDFLRARLDEDEAKAREAIAMREATPLLDPEASTRPDYALVPWEDVGVPAMLIGPERVLREVKAHRRIIQQHDAWPVLVEAKPEFEKYTDPTDLQGITFRMSQQMEWLTTREYVARFGTEPPTTPMLRALANIYADHPDYDPTWEQPGGVA